MSNEQKKQVQADYFIDITGEVCPMTFVKTKLQLEKLSSGQVLEVRLTGKEPLENVPRSTREQGDDVLDLAPEEEGSDIYRLFIRRS